jgi:hypothetical protein
MLACAEKKLSDSTETLELKYKNGIVQNKSKLSSNTNTVCSLLYFHV